ncbi:hypothetical protein LEL_05146 [Akanthomyces lecanii RCEF 1005]|uniref:LysM domain-containing protein n=1 Tax=Akanthomyces lecanii RCEF 1005 TaxID=1081108 RepID=A0A162K848_CORDF|nr:hypothetical protein LEL_05146 [Akanthomyces lecanii RCEF 1005]
MTTCSTCLTILAPGDGEKLSEKPPPDQRRVPCCDRIICGDCIVNNFRFAAYCPYCQIASEPNPLPQGLKAPPAYEASQLHAAKRQRQPPPRPSPAYDPPPYGTCDGGGDDEKAAAADDTLHFLNHEHDSILSLSLRYGVPQDALRRANNINSDHLLLARKTVVIPAAYYKGGVSLSPRPVEGEDEELRKSKIRRLMTACKLADYAVAQLYLEQAGYNLERAVDRYVGDEAWEQAQRDKNKNNASNMRWFFGGMR